MAIKKKFLKTAFKEFKDDFIYKEGEDLLPLVMPWSLPICATVKLLLLIIEFFLGSLTFKSVMEFFLILVALLLVYLFTIYVYYKCEIRDADAEAEEGKL